MMPHKSSFQTVLKLKVCFPGKHVIAIWFQGNWLLLKIKKCYFFAHHCICVCVCMYQYMYIDMDILRYMREYVIAFMLVTVFTVAFCTHTISFDGNLFLFLSCLHFIATKEEGQIRRPAR